MCIFSKIGSISQLTFSRMGNTFSKKIPRYFVKSKPLLAAGPLLLVVGLLLHGHARELADAQHALQRVLEGVRVRVRERVPAAGVGRMEVSAMEINPGHREAYTYKIHTKSVIHCQVCRDHFHNCVVVPSATRPMTNPLKPDLQEHNLNGRATRLDERFRFVFVASRSNGY